ncbi:methyltransferase domain-containing protein [Aliiroseovarius sp. 2305UL8-7]|uniref:methyltransferase domain-containing protein n=1 Tax=Aliiroseovarius conchicola TaxID=3121637 RepID=UPI0035298B52
MKKQFEDLGATLVEIGPFGDGDARYCNKILQLESPTFIEADFVILSDADLLFLADPAELVVPNRFRAKPVDLPNPPTTIWDTLFELANLRDKVEEVPLELCPSDTTFSTNYNGGLYVIPRSMIEKVAEKWRGFSTLCLDNAGLMKNFSHHADQVGMGMAVADLGLNVEPLTIAENFPSHLPHDLLEPVECQKILGLHYHGHIDPHGLPMDTGLDWLDQQISVARNQLSSARRDDFSNELFWDFRYQKFPELGSGVGSRNEVLELKRNKLRTLFKAIGTDTILDVGCGDLEVVGPLLVASYTGSDISSAAIQTAKSKYPSTRFENKTSSAYGDESFDYTLCVDVLIHQPSLADARALADDLLRVARKGVILSTHTSGIGDHGISFDTSTIKDYLSSKPEVTRLVELLTYRDVTLYFIEKNLGSRRSLNDIGIPELAVGHEIADEGAELTDLIAYSQEKIGFFPVTVIRTHEYPWFVDHLRDCRGKAALDVGAGVSCIPFKLADFGAQVTTVDLHQIIRNEQPMETWNEWGYLDYSQLDPRIKSFNADMAKVDLGTKFDIIYSVSVIEHMPAEMRRSVIRQMAANSNRGAKLVLSLDIIPDTNELWNLSEGNTVDTRDHGTIDDVKTELRQAGFGLDHEHILRGVQYSRTDVLYLTGRYTGVGVQPWTDRIRSWLRRV